MNQRTMFSFLLPVLLFLSLVLTGCIVIPSAPMDVEVDQSEQDEVEAQPDLSDVEVPPLIIWSDEARLSALEAMGTQFTEDFGVEVVVVAKTLSEILNDFKAALGSGSTEPDILFGGSDWVGLLASNGVITPIDMAGFEENFGPGVLRSMAYEGFQYGVPVTADSLALFYNTDLVTEVPTTWTGIADVAFSLMQSDQVDLGIAVNMYSPFDLYPVITGRGGDLFAWNAETGYDLSTPLLGSQETVDSILFLQSLDAAGLIDSSLGGASVEELINEGRVPFVVSGPWNLPRIRQSQANWSAAPFPEGSGSFVNVLGYMINARGPDPFFAWHFLESQVLTEAGMQALQLAAPGIPAWLPILPGLEDGLIADLGLIAAQGRAVPTFPEMNEVWKAWGEAQLSVVDGGIDPHTAYAEAGSVLVDILALRLAAQSESE